MRVENFFHRKDPVPIMPGRFLGYHHPIGELHIQATGSWLSCPGNDNPDKRCSVGDVKDVFSGNLNDHKGDDLRKLLSSRLWLKTKVSF